MAKVNGKAKGARAELELCKRFSDWWGVPDAFGKTPGSGSFATRRKKLGKDEAEFEADLFGPKECSLAIESKKREQWNPAHLHLPLDNKKPVAQWWQQTVSQASGDKVPLLVFGKNRLFGNGASPWLVMLPAEKVLSQFATGLMNCRIQMKDGVWNKTAVLPLDTFLHLYPAFYFGKAPNEPL